MKQRGILGRQPTQRAEQRHHPFRVADAAQDDRQVVQRVGFVAAATRGAVQQTGGVLDVPPRPGGKAGQQLRLRVGGIAREQWGAACRDGSKPVRLQIVDRSGQNGDTVRGRVMRHGTRTPDGMTMPKPRRAARETPGGASEAAAKAARQPTMKPAPVRMTERGASGTR